MKKFFLICIITTFMLTGCVQTQINTSSTSSFDNYNDSFDIDKIKEDIITCISSNEEMQCSLERILFLSDENSGDCSIHLSWTDSDTFLNQCYFILKDVKNILDSYEYIYNSISIAASPDNDSSKNMRLDFSLDNEIAFFDNSQSDIKIKKYTYEQLAEITGNAKPKVSLIEKPESMNNVSVIISSAVENDQTGNWKFTKLSTTKDIEYYVLDYYKTFFSSDDEIHAIINVKSNTTSKISVLSDGFLDVTIQEYVEDEELDADTLFSGTMLKEFWVNIETGEIEEIP